MFFSSKNGHFFNINGACKAIDVDKRREVVIKIGKTSTNNRSFSISKEPTARYFLKCNYCAVGSWEIVKDLLLALVFLFFSILMVHAKLLMSIQDVKLS